ncbi:MAG: diversity-generating retroelement protein Avd [Candidatus Andersenbacteria bacterium]
MFLAPPRAVPPPGSFGELPILHTTTQAYQSWHRLLPHVPRFSRHTLGEKIDNLFLELLELLLRARYTAREQKVGVITAASAKLDTLKYLLQVAWQLKLIETRQYEHVSAPLVEVGKMLGGWHRQANQNLRR